jgi:GAF domain-containing protein
MGRRAKEIAPELVALSVGIVADGLTFTLVADERAAPVDAVQYLAGGPCVEAIAADEVVETSNEALLDEGRWQLYAQASAAAGIASSLSVPVLEDGTVVGGVNFYGAAEAPGRLADRAEIDVAVGIIAAREGVDAQTAEQRLRDAAARASVTQLEVARAVISAQTP